MGLSLWVFVAALCAVGAPLAPIQKNAAFDDEFSLEGTRSPHRVAIIGGGASGASTAHFLRKYFPKRTTLQIDVFEAGAVAGGRAKSVLIDGKLYEAGGSLFADQNKYCVSIAAQYGFEPVRMADQRLVIWDGATVQFHSHPWNSITAMKMLWRYGTDLFTMKTKVTEFVDAFGRIYELQDRGVKFASPEGLLSALGLFNFTQMSLKSYLGEDSAVNELATAVLMNIYNQNTSLNALAGIVGLTPLSVGSDSIWRADQGNFMVWQKAIEGAASFFIKSHRVTRISRNAKTRRFSLSVSGADINMTYEGYDAVVIACPLEVCGIQLDTSTAAATTIPKRKYKTVEVTFVQGVLKPEYFGLSSQDGIGTVLASRVDTVFNSMGTVVPPHPVTSQRVVKFFSHAPLPPATLDAMFQPKWSVLHHLTWKAYPVFSPPEAFAPFQLADGLYYPSAIENAASAMEVMAVAGRNAALLIVEHLTGEAAPQQSAGNWQHAFRGDGVASHAHEL